MPQRCQAPKCKKCLPTVPLQCRCGKRYCMGHLSLHPCSIDFLELQQRELRHALTAAVARKVASI